LAAWVIAKIVSVEAAKDALHYVAPVDEKDAFVELATSNILPYLP